MYNIKTICDDFSKASMCQTRAKKVLHMLVEWSPPTNYLKARTLSRDINLFSVSTPFSRMGKDSKRMKGMSNKEQAAGAEWEGNTTS